MLIKVDENYYKEKLTRSGDVHKVLHQVLNKFDTYDQDKEFFFVIGLKRSNRIKYIDVCSMGGLHSTIVGAREVFRRAIVEASAAIILGHNHPSGEVVPSEADKKITRVLCEAGKLLDIKVIDHVIFANDSFYSFADEGELL